MNRRPSLQLQNTLDQLRSAEKELDELNRQLSTFEALVDAQLGSLLDQLSELNVETASLDNQLRRIREERLFGGEVMSYQDGAPRPARHPNVKEAPAFGLSQREDIHAKSNTASHPELVLPDIKVLYRKLARRYHPDLARSEADRAVSTAQMAEINQAYNAGDLKALMRLAGIGLPYGVELPQPQPESRHLHNAPITEQEQAERKLKTVHQQITRMSNLPIVKLSLEVKLAQHQGRNLLREMAVDLQYKIGRKLAERDYLEAQIKASGLQKGE